jgi:hypothetical protein
MREYGPAVFAAYEGAAILGTRAEQFMRALLSMPPDRALQFLQQYEGLTTDPVTGQPVASHLGTSPGVAASGIEPSRSDRPDPLRARIRAARRARGI